MSSHNPHARRITLLAVALIAVAVTLAYSNTLHAPLIFDDIDSIRDNPILGRLVPSMETLRPEKATAFSARPVTFFTMSLNYHLSGHEVWSYRIVNAAIHALAALALFGVLRRTMRTPTLAPGLGHVADWLALAVALLWVVHPIQTASVTCVVRRGETLMGLFYLLTLYGTIRGVESGRRGWYGLAVVACALGMGTKEVMVSAPLAVLLYDRLFLATSMREIMRRRWGLYAGLFATWSILAFLVSLNAHASSVRVTEAGLTPWTYLCTQAWAIVLYLKLVFWPSPLILDYGHVGSGVTLLTRFSEYAPYGVVVLALLGATLWALWRRPAIGFAGACFFMILAPSSSFLPLQTEAVVEHRMYLPLACVLIVVIVGGYAWLAPRLRETRGHGAVAMLHRAGAAAIVVAACVLSWMTFDRNHDYRSNIAIWEDSLNKWPVNARGSYNLGVALGEEGRDEEALFRFREALALRADSADSHHNIGLLLHRNGQADTALDHLRKAIDLVPHEGEYHESLGLTLLQMGRLTEALDALREAKRLGHESAKRLSGEGWILFEMGQYDEAIRTLRAAIALDPKPPANHGLLGMALLARDRVDEAVAAFENLLRVDPNNPGAHTQLGVIARSRGDVNRAADHFRAALRIDPNFYHARQELESLDRR